ncbi:hypothetical protein NST62_03365 [Ureibacillus sp. FSL K6-8385]|uniref:Sporulation integral membrane protein YlbJ n=1 Tax=Ureibacillus terrenus TaxID=118246 RepID=A0A540V451_9BACL|nr:hypothetical protein [Ureibacillus terrenus]MED3660298.1 hypothetical protein [Ureibacillus terrenus]MED3764956.1 hypothetical protein [Ureibacillus terrenus]TQE91526.1 hypothetical protein FKZ59_04065 [Ureibacillus terrenus]
MLFPGIAHKGADLGLELFLEALFPYLLPYLILTQWFIRLTPEKDNSLSRFKLYIKTYGISALGGFPTGAATVAYLKRTNQISKSEANGLLSICHSPSPLFVLGFVGHDLLNNTRFSWQYLILYHTVSLFILVMYYFYHRSNPRQEIKSYNLRKNENPFISSIKDSIPTVLVVGSTIIFFTTIYTVVIYTIQTIFPNIHKNLLLLTAASLEMTNGLQISQKIFSNEPALLPLLMATFLSSQSLSIHMQVAVIAKSESISLKPYILLRIFFTLVIPILYFILFL